MTDNNNTVLEIGGAGGGKRGGGSGRVAVEAPDSLRSTSTLEVLEVISEGEIRGFAGPDLLSSVYIDGTPLKSGDTVNFNGVSVLMNNGTQDQLALPGFNDPGSPAVEVEVSQRVKHGSPHVKRISNPNVDTCRVSISLPRLLEQKKTNGDVVETGVEISLHVSANGEAYQAVDLSGRGVFQGKTSSAYLRSYRFDLRQFGNPPYDIRMTRVTADSDSLAISNETHWVSYTEIISGKFRYPNSATVRISVDAQQLNRVPVRGYLIYGLIVQVPTNYNPLTLEYTGEWNGTFKVAWTNNPAWVFYDMLSDERYGLGKEVPVELRDKWSLYVIGQYCDQLVPDGAGGQEPRFTANLYLQQAGEAYRVMQDLASIFRGVIYWGSGGVLTATDTVKPVTAQYVPANVIDGRFTYSGTARESRYTVALVAWNNPANEYKREIEYVEDPAGIERYGYIETDVISVGCQSRGQAHRAGKALLLTSRLETDSVVFGVGLDGMLVLPGDVIRVVDPNRSVSVVGGRITAAPSVGEVTLDRDVVLTSGVTYTVALFTASGALYERVVTNLPGTVAEGTSLTFTPSLPSTPLDYSVWTVRGSGGLDALYRVVSIEENDESSADGFFQVAAVQYDGSKYALIDGDVQLEYRPPKEGRAIQPPSSLIVSDGVYVAPEGMHRYIDLSWSMSPGPFLSHHVVSYTSPAGDIIEVRVLGQNYRVVDPVPGTHLFTVYAVDIGGRVSTGISGQLVLAELAPIDQISVTGLELRGQGNSTEFTGPDADFTWRVTSVFGYEMGEEPFGADSGGNDPWFRDYEVTIYAPGAPGASPRRIEHVTTPHYIYSFAKNTEDGTPIRDFIIKVAVRDVYNRLSRAAILRVSNPPPVDFGAVQYTQGFESIWVEYIKPADPDYLHTRLYVSDVPGFTPGPATLRNTSNDLVISADNLTGDTYYLRLEGVDAFGPAGVYTSEVMITMQSTARVLNRLAGQITDSQLHADLLAQITSNNGEAAVAAEALIREAADGLLNAQYTIKADVNGHVAGMGLAVVGGANGPTSSKIIMLADQFAVGLPVSTWQPNSTYLQGQYVKSTAAFVTANGNPGVIYKKDNVGSGVTGGTEPVWTVPGVLNATFVNGGVTWRAVAIEETVPFTVGVVDGLPKVVMSSAMIGDASIDWAKIAYAEITDADVLNMSVTKLMGGAITAISDIYLGNSENGTYSFRMSAANRNLKVFDTQPVPQERVTLGKLGASSTDYGITIRNAAGAVVLSSVEGINTATLGLGDFSFIDQLTAANISTYVSSLAIGSAYIAEGAINNAKISGDIYSDNFWAGSVGWRIRKSSGNAEFNSLTVRNGVVVGGELQGTIGTFSGSLTAAAVNAVNTVNIAGNAVSLVFSSAQAASPEVHPAYNWVTIASTSWTASGGTVAAFGSVRVRGSSSASTAYVRVTIQNSEGVAIVIPLLPFAWDPGYEIYIYSHLSISAAHRLVNVSGACTVSLQVYGANVWYLHGFVQGMEMKR